jgi:hypothetical protein
LKAYVDSVCGFSDALRAMRLSFGSESNQESLVKSQGWSIHEDNHALLLKLIKAGDSHAKVTRMIQVWLDLTLPRYLWAEFDQYRVGTTSMSESTVHTLLKELKKGIVSIDRFEYTENTEYNIRAYIVLLREAMIDGATIEEIKQLLPESFLQRRIVNLNYQTLRHIYFDRRNHRLESWHILLNSILEQIPFPEFITVEKGE